jgi:hypothetical protein
MRSCSSLSLAVALGVLVASSASAGAKPRRKPKVSTKHEPAPARGFWKVLVQPHAKWRLYMGGQTDPKAPDYHEPITIETYDIRKVGDADVARLRWRQGTDDESPLAGTQAPPLDQFAVTSKGLYLLTADMDDDKIALVLQRKPSRSDPPKPYRGTKINDGRYLELRDGFVCMGQGPTPDAPECEDTCDGDICISATDGIVRLEGNWAPDMFDYMQVKSPRTRK